MSFHKKDFAHLWINIISLLSVIYNPQNYKTTQRHKRYIDPEDCITGKAVLKKMLYFP